MNQARRDHYSRTRIDRLEDFVQVDGRTKPLGLWYGVDDGWREWCESEMPDWIAGRWVYPVDVSACNILHIGDVWALDEFTERYGEHRPGSYARIQIDWPAVAAEYDGIEIAPYQWDRRMEYMWYYGWDCASGCVWRTGGVVLGEPAWCDGLPDLVTA